MVERRGNCGLKRELGFIGPGWRDASARRGGGLAESIRIRDGGEVSVGTRRDYEYSVVAIAAAGAGRSHLDPGRAVAILVDGDVAVIHEVPGVARRTGAGGEGRSRKEQRQQNNRQYNLPGRFPAGCFARPHDLYPLGEFGRRRSDNTVILVCRAKLSRGGNPA